MGAFNFDPKTGKMVFTDGTMWNANDPLPPEQGQNFNQTPIGNPLVPGVPSLASPPPAAPPPAPAGLQGMFGNRSMSMPTPGGNSVAPALPTGLPDDSAALGGQMPQFAAPQVAKPHIGFGDPGGLGDKLSNIGAILLAASGNPGGGALLEAQNQRRQSADQDRRQVAQQGAELQRQLALKQWAILHPEPTEAMRNAAGTGLTPGTQAYNDYVTNATMAPVITTVNGQPMAYSRAQLNQGIAGSGGAAPSFPRVTDAASYGALKSGDHFLDPDGNVRVKP